MRRHARTKTRQIITHDLLDLEDARRAEAAEEEKINAEIRADLYHAQLMLSDLLYDERQEELEREVDARYGDGATSRYYAGDYDYDYGDVSMLGAGAAGSDW